MSTIKSILGTVGLVLVTATLAVAQPAGNTKEYKWDVLAPIPDNDPTGLSNTQTVPDDMLGLNRIGDVDVDLQIEHTWQGDLIVELEHQGIVVPLLYRSGASNGTGNGFSENNFGNLDLDTKFILDDEADQPYDDDDGWGTLPDGIDNVDGRWVPYGMFPGGGIGGLSAFDGMDKRGEWTLTVSDNSSGDAGRLINWSLHIENVPEPSMGLLGLLGLVSLIVTRRRQA